MPPGSAKPSRRAATFTPSPRMSPSSTMMSPMLMPMRKAMRRSSGSAASRSATPFWIATAHSTASTALGELDQRAVAHQLDDAAAVLGDQRLDELLAQRLQARDRAGLVGPHEPAVADHVRGQNRRQLPFHARRPWARLHPRRHNWQRSASLAGIRAPVDVGRSYGAKRGVSRRAPGPDPRSDRPGPPGRPRGAAGRRRCRGARAPRRRSAGAWWSRDG